MYLNNQVVRKADNLTNITMIWMSWSTMAATCLMAPICKTTTKEIKLINKKGNRSTKMHNKYKEFNCLCMLYKKVL